MVNKAVKCGKLNISNINPFTLIAGPCQLESEKHALDVAIELNTGIKRIAATARSEINGIREIVDLSMETKIAEIITTAITKITSKNNLGVEVKKPLINIFFSILSIFCL